MSEAIYSCCEISEIAVLAGLSRRMAALMSTGEVLDRWSDIDTASESECEETEHDSDSYLSSVGTDDSDSSEDDSMDASSSVSPGWQEVPAGKSSCLVCEVSKVYVQG